MRFSPLVLDEDQPGFHQGRLGRVAELLDRGAEDGVYPGAVALIAHRGRVVFWRAAGIQQSAPEPRDAMPRDAVFDLASVTKPVAGGSALLLLIEDGLVTLDDPVSDYVPEFRGGDKGAVRIRHLLSHTSGVASNPKLYHEHRTWETLREANLALPLYAPPGSAYLYSSINYLILTMIAERVSGQNLDALLGERVFGPLGMVDTTFNPAPELRSRIPATEYVQWRDEYDWGVVNDKTAQLMGGVSTHAGLFATAWDLAVFAHALFSGGGGVFSPAGVRLFLSRIVQEPTGRGFAWWPGNTRTFGDLLGKRSYGHTGTTGTALCLVPEEQLAIVLLTNRVHPSRDNELIVPFRPRFFNAVAAAQIDV